MTTVNHLKSRDAQRQALTVAFGYHDAEGHYLWSRIEGTSPNQQIVGFNRLGEGEWYRPLKLYFKGFPLADWDFHEGGHATSMADVDSEFPLDVPHSHTATIRWKGQPGVGDFESEQITRGDLHIYCETKLCPDFNSSGVQTDFSYTPNPAREIIELLKTYARLPNLPSAWASAAAYWLSRIDWGAWVDYRDFCLGTETVDYRTLPDFPGFGLWAEYWEGTNFTTIKEERVEPVIDLQFGTGSPASHIAVDGFSARLEGFIKFKYSQTYTLTINADDGVRLWVNGSLLIDQWADDGSVTAGTQTATFTATAGQFYTIKIEFNENTGGAALSLKWSSTSQVEQIVPSKFLYPKVRSESRYEWHGFFDTPTAPIDAINTILTQTNAIRQDVNGKIRFLPLELLSPSGAFEFDPADTNILEKGFNFTRRDILQSEQITTYEAQFRALYSQFLQEPTTPVLYQVPNLTRKSRENIKVVNLFNTTHWRALKVLQMLAKLETGNDLLTELISPAAKSWGVMPGDLVKVKHRKISADLTAKNYLVRQSTDSGVRESNRNRSEEIETRTFKLQEWS
jgi:hypothetical protein